MHGRAGHNLSKVQKIAQETIEDWEAAIELIKSDPVWANDTVVQYVGNGPSKNFVPIDKYRNFSRLITYGNPNQHTIDQRCKAITAIACHFMTVRMIEDATSDSIPYILKNFCVFSYWTGSYEATGNDAAFNPKLFGAMGAAARHAKDPKQEAKRHVYDCWKDWQAGIHQYKSKAAFARDMMAKWEVLESQKVITDRWCKYWAQGKDIPTLPAE